MSGRVNHLSAVLIKSLSQPGYYDDGTGLYLQVSVSGSKSWIFRFSMAGKRREMGLGPLHTVSLAIAREKAQECRRLVAGGIDPIAVRDPDRTSQALSAARLKPLTSALLHTSSRTAPAGKVPSTRHSGKRRSLRMPGPCSERCR